VLRTKKKARRVGFEQRRATPRGRSAARGWRMFPRRARPDCPARVRPRRRCAVPRVPRSGTAQGAPARDNHPHTHTNRHRHTDTHRHRHTDTPSHRHTDTHTRTHTHTHIQTHTYTHTYTQTHTQGGKCSIKGAARRSDGQRVQARAAWAGDGYRRGQATVTSGARRCGTAKSGAQRCGTAKSGALRGGTVTSGARRGGGLSRPCSRPPGAGRARSLSAARLRPRAQRPL